MLGSNVDKDREDHKLNNSIIATMGALLQQRSLPTNEEEWRYSTMRRFATSTRTVVKFAVGANSASWLIKAVTEFSRLTVDGMSFAQALLPWSVALTGSIPASITSGHSGTFVKVAPKTTQTYGDEHIITASRELLQPLIDMLAILVDGDRQEVQHLDQKQAEKLYHYLCDWYQLEARLRSEMRTTYRADGNQPFAHSLPQ